MTVSLLLSGCAPPATRPAQSEEFALTDEPVEVLRALERGRPGARLTREAKAILHGPQPEK